MITIQDKNVKTNQKLRKTKYIHSNKLAGFLVMAGCKLLKIKPNLKNSIFNIYIFVDDEKLQSNIGRFMEENNAIVEFIKSYTIKKVSKDEVEKVEKVEN